MNGQAQHGALTGGPSGVAVSHWSAARPLSADSIKDCRKQQILCLTADSGGLMFALAGLFVGSSHGDSRNPFHGCRHLSSERVWNGNHPSSVAFDLHVRAKDVCVQFETGYKGPPPASAERSCGTAIRSRCNSLNDAHSGVAPKSTLTLHDQVLGTNPCGVHQRACSVNHYRDWSWKPDREAQAWLDKADAKKRASKAEKKSAKKAKKRRNSLIRKTIAKYAVAKPADFYDSWEWKKLRFEVLKKYGPVCMCCRSTEWIVVDHIKPRRRFPELELSFENMQVLCDSCNRGKSNDDYTDFRPVSFREREIEEIR